MQSTYRPGDDWRRQRSSGRSGLKRTLAWVFLLLLIAGGVFLLVRHGCQGCSSASSGKAAGLREASEAARAEWIRINGELTQASEAGQPTEELSARLAAATTAWAEAARRLNDAIELKRGEWREATAAGNAAGAERIASELAALGAAPEEPPPPSRFRKTPANPRFGEGFDYQYALHGDLDIPARNKRPAVSSRAATSGILVDLDTRKVLWEKNSTKPVPIASMVKMMTMLLTMEAFDVHREWTLDTPVKITDIVKTVPRDGVIYLDTRETFSIGDLLKAITIKSANDAAWQLGEFVNAGDAEGFVAIMNRRARELGMTATNYTSPCGLPRSGHGDSTSTARDLVLLAEEILQYPVLMEYASIQETSLPRALPPGSIHLTNTNKLVNPRWPGVDGLKTGFIRASGFCVTLTCLRDGRRLAAVVTGFPTAAERDRFCREMLDWGYRKAAELETGGR